MKKVKTLNRISLVIIVLAVMLMLSGCGGGSDEGVGNAGPGVATTFGWKITIQLTDSSNNHVGAVTLNHITVSTDSGVISGLAYANASLSFDIDDIAIQPCIVTLTISAPGYCAITRQYRACCDSLTDESGDNFKTTLIAHNDVPSGTGVGDSNAVAADGETGLTEQMTMQTPVDAGNGTTGTVLIPTGTVLGTGAGSSAGTMTITMLVHNGNDANSRQFFAGGTFTGIVIDPTGYPGFSSTGQDFYTGDAKPAMFSNVEIRDQNNNLITHGSVNPTCTFTLPAGQTDQNGNPVQVGDSIPFFVYDHSNGIWIFIATVQVTQGTGGALQVQTAWQYPNGTAGSRQTDIHRFPNFGGFFYLSNIEGEDQDTPPFTGGG